MKRRSAQEEREKKSKSSSLRNFYVRLANKMYNKRRNMLELFPFLRLSPFFRSALAFRAAGAIGAVS